MLTKEDKENIKALLQDKQRDKIYRQWTRRIVNRLPSLRIHGDDKLDRDIIWLEERLMDLDHIYAERLVPISNTCIARKHGCNYVSIRRIERELFGEHIRDPVNHSDSRAAKKLPQKKRSTYAQKRLEQIRAKA